MESTEYEGRTIMRIFFVINHSVDLKDFSLNALSSDNGRVDLVCKLIKDSFLISNSIRKDTVLYIFFSKGKKTIMFIGNQLLYLNPDERSIASILKKVFSSYIKEKIIGKEYSPGIYLYDWDIKDVLKRINLPVVLLLEEGIMDITKIRKNVVFVLSDHTNFSREEIDIIKNYNPFILKISPYSLHTDQCITIIHNALDVML
jgi:tRNA (pseudouridine54-N1)-methyltransferase